MTCMMIEDYMDDTRVFPESRDLTSGMVNAFMLHTTIQHLLLRAFVGCP